MALIEDLGARPPARGLALGAAVALAFAALFFTFGDGFRVPFINDDFIFLDRTRDASFVSLWRTDSLMFGWYRPWSRELHYWWLQLWGNPSPIAFHAVSFGLVVLLLGAYYSVARRAAGPAAAAIALAGVAAMGAWAVPMLWAAGAQELWMLFAVLLCLVAHGSGQKWIAAIAFAIALLSKETAAVAVVIAFFWSVTVGRKSLSDAISDTLPMLGVLAVWAFIHPTVTKRLWDIAAPLDPTAALPVAGLHPGPASVLTRSLLMLLNLDHPISPELGWLGPLGAALPAAIALGLLVWLGTRNLRKVEAAKTASDWRPALKPGAVMGVHRWERKTTDRDFAMAEGRTRILALVFALLWTALGWLPLLDPRIGWHSYYGLLGALGAWLALGAALSFARVRYVALALVVIATLLRGGAAATPSSDWGSAWYQRRAAEFLEFMRADLLEKEPSPPHRSRFYFTGVPSQVGFLTEGGPALRVWYADTTLSGGFLSQYERRGVWEGTDFFFRYDSTAGWTRLGEGRAMKQADEERWLSDHYELASAFARAEDWPAASREYVSLANRDTSQAKYAEGAAVSLAMTGDSLRAARWFAVAAASPDADSSLKRLARDFIRRVKRTS